MVRTKQTAKKSMPRAAEKVQKRQLETKRSSHGRREREEELIKKPKRRYRPGMGDNFNCKGVGKDARLNVLFLSEKSR
jgi:hypothetical protein